MIVCSVYHSLLHYHPTEASQNYSGLMATELKALDIKSREPFLYFKCGFYKKDRRYNPVFKLLSELTEKNKELDKVKD